MISRIREYIDCIWRHDSARDNLEINVFKNQLKNCFNYLNFFDLK